MKSIPALLGASGSRLRCAGERFEEFGGVGVEPGSTYEILYGWRGRVHMIIVYSEDVSVRRCGGRIFIYFFSFQ